MNTHELARQLLDLPDSKIVASVDLEDEGKLFAESICDVFTNRNEVVIHFEISQAQNKKGKADA